MAEAFQLQIRKDALKYLDKLDSRLRERIKAKLREVVSDPYDTRMSKPLISSAKRSTRVGEYRVLFVIEGNVVLVTDIDSRGGIYRNI